MLAEVVGRAQRVDRIYDTLRNLLRHFSLVSD